MVNKFSKKGQRKLYFGRNTLNTWTPQLKEILNIFLYISITTWKYFYGKLFINPLLVFVKISHLISWQFNKCSKEKTDSICLKILAIKV